MSPPDHPVRPLRAAGVVGLLGAAVLGATAVVTATPTSTEAGTTAARQIAVDRRDPGDVPPVERPTTTSGSDPATRATDAPRRRAQLPSHPPVSSSEPSRLRIPAIGVVAGVVDLGLTDDGALEVPDGPTPAGWYVGSPTPGALGPAVLAGHVSWNGTPGVFSRLGELEPGDRVSVVREDGLVADFRVTRTQAYPKDRFPTRAVYRDIDRAGLRLITCAGLDTLTSTYTDNLVVFARLTGTRRLEEGT